MGHIFISYSHKDKEYVHRLEEALQRQGLEVWIDDRIDYGAEWPRIIQDHLDECAAFVIVVTQNSYDSRWVQNELARAGRKKKPTFPLLLEGEQWLSIEATQYFDVTDGSLPTEKFFERIAAVISRNEEVVRSEEQAGTSEPNTSVTVTKSNIEFRCRLPSGLGNQGGDGQIILERPFTSVWIDVPRKVILGELMRGLNTPLDWSDRPYIIKTESGEYEAFIGPTNVTLSEDETRSLCNSIDAVCGRYKQNLIQTEYALETWEYPTTEYEDVYGFKLLRVKQKLWELMHRFSDEFDYAQGDTEWHIFSRQSICIRVGEGFKDHAFLWPMPVIDSWSNLPTEEIDVFYEVDDFHLEREGRLADTATWQECVGEQGIWTAKYTEQWIKDRFIPRVLEHYKEEINQEESYDARDYRAEVPTLFTVSKLSDLAYYLQIVQSWLSACHAKISSALVEPFYRAFIEICKSTNAPFNYHYINEKLTVAHNIASGELIFQRFQSRDEVISSLIDHLNRISNTSKEASEIADNISRIFLAIINESKIELQHRQIRAAKNSLQPLVQESRFFEHFIWPNMD